MGWLLAAALYALPDGYVPVVPDAGQQARLDRALTELRGHDLSKRERAARDLALIGDPALPAIVARLNQAGSAERVALLMSIARLPAAAPVIEQAQRDPDPAVRASTSPPKREPEKLARLAARYIDLVALTGETNRKEFAGQLKGLTPELVRPEEQYEQLRERLGDQQMDGAIQYEYRVHSLRFARAADAALRSGSLKPDLDDPVFVAFLGLLYDEEVAALNAVRTLVAIGEQAAPALEGLLDRKRHDPRTILHILVASGQGARAMARDATDWVDLRFAQIELASRALPAGEAAEFLVTALQDADARNRKQAMRGLLAIGNIHSSRLKAPMADFGDEEWELMMQLIVASGEHRFLHDSLLAEGPRQRAALRMLRTMSPDQRQKRRSPRWCAAGGGGRR